MLRRGCQLLLKEKRLMDVHHVGLVFVGITTTLICVITNMEGIKDIHEGVWAIVKCQA
jgi:hypothetical protein